MNIPRDIEILLEMIADNYNLLEDNGGDIDLSLYQEICDNLGFNLNEYLKTVNNRPGRFKESVNRETLKVNLNLWITISSENMDMGGHECISKTDVLNLDNGCLIRVTLLKATLKEYSDGQISESIQFIPDINIELDDDGKVIEKISKYSSVLQPLNEYIPYECEPIRAVPLYKRGVEITCENINTLDDDKVSTSYSDPKYKYVDTFKLKK